MICQSAVTVTSARTQMIYACQNPLDHQGLHLYADEEVVVTWTQ